MLLARRGVKRSVSFKKLGRYFFALRHFGHLLLFTAFVKVSLIISKLCLLCILSLSARQRLYCTLVRILKHTYNHIETGEPHTFEQSQFLIFWNRFTATIVTSVYLFVVQRGTKATWVTTFYRKISNTNLVSASTNIATLPFQTYCPAGFVMRPWNWSHSQR